MRDVRFKTYSAGHLANPWEHKTLFDFIFIVSNLRSAILRFKAVPPIHILNEIFENGEDDSGMGSGSEWQPFSISQAEYDEFVEDLLTDPQYDCEIDIDLWECATYSKWQGKALSKYDRVIRENR